MSFLNIGNVVLVPSSFCRADEEATTPRLPLVDAATAMEVHAATTTKYQLTANLAEMKVVVVVVADVQVLDVVRCPMTSPMFLRRPIHRNRSWRTAIDELSTTRSGCACCGWLRIVPCVEPTSASSQPLR